ncbi:MAG: hypothetical protein WAM91_10980 [Candidatus Acidiferrales bacterium]
MAITCSVMHKLSDDESRKLRTWDAAEKQSMETLAELKAEMDALSLDKVGAGHCDDSDLSSYFQCIHTGEDRLKAASKALDEKRQDAIDAANSEGAKVGRTFNPR